MRLLFLTNYFPPHNLGGYEVLCAEVANGFRDRGHTVCVLTSDHMVKGQIVPEQDVHRILHTEVDTHPLGASLRFFVGRTQRLRENIQLLQHTNSNFGPDLLLVWGMWNLPRQILTHVEALGYPVVYYVSDYWPTLPDAWTLHWREPARRWYTRLPKRILSQIACEMLAREAACPVLRFDHTICASEAVRRRLSTFSSKFERATVIYYGVNTQLFSDGNGPRRALQDRLSLLYAGRLSHEKGVQTAIEAICQGSLVLNAHLTIVGSGSAGYRLCLQNLARELGVTKNITFREHVPRDRMPQLLREFDALIVPSLWEEPFPLIVQEAMACGLAVIASRVGGIPEIVQDGVNGLLFQPGNAVDLGRRVAEFKSDPSLRRRLAEQGFRTVSQKFNTTRMLDELDAYLETVVA